MFIQTVQKKSIYGYRNDGPGNLFLRIFVRLPSFIAPAKRILEKGGFSVEGLGSYSVENTFESNLQYSLRFMIDHKVTLGS